MSTRLVVRWYHVAPAVIALVLLGAWLAWRALESQQPPEPVDGALVEDPSELGSSPPSLTEESEGERDLARQAVTLYWPRADGAGLEAIEAEIFATPHVTDRAKQVVELLLRGPIAAAAAAPPLAEASPPGAGSGNDEAPSESRHPDAAAAFLAPLPKGTRLRAAFIDGAGTAYVSLSSEMTQAAWGGSARELAAAYSIVNSLVRSLPEVERVQFLVEGREIESIGGHLDARFPLAFNERVVIEPRKGT